MDDIKEGGREPTFSVGKSLGVLWRGRALTPDSHLEGRMGVRPFWKERLCLCLCVRAEGR